MPKEVGGILRRIVGAKEAAEVIKSTKFKQLRRRLVNEHALLSLEEAIVVMISGCYALIFEDGEDLNLYKQVKWCR